MLLETEVDDNFSDRRRQAPQASPQTTRLVDPLGRRITYVRVSVTDRCDLRCHYCMTPRPTFMPKRDLLALEELDRICAIFVRLSIRKLRITGGEPLLRRDVMTLFAALHRHLASGSVDELTLTTNGGRLAEHASKLADCGVRRVNVSVDTRNPEKFRRITGGGDLGRVLAGVTAAKAAGLRVKINAVALRGVNDDELSDMVAWCGREGFDLTLIELMPTVSIGEDDVHGHFLPLTTVRAGLARQWTLTDINQRTGGPARYVRVEENGLALGFISPFSGNFCAGCNRVRLTATGRLYTCLGHAGAADLRTPLRRGASEAELEDTIRAAVDRKPAGHEFAKDGGDRSLVGGRSMNVTGG